MIKNFWNKILGNVAGDQNKTQLIRRLGFDLDRLNNESLKKNYKKISKSQIDVLETSQEHHEKFLKALNDAKKSLILISHWTKNDVMNDEFETSLRACLTRGVNVYVGNSFQQSDDHKPVADSEPKAKKKFKELQDWCFRELGQGCRLHKIDLPSLKTILIVDDKYLINGNCENEDRSWVIYDKDFVTSERDAIIGNLDGPLEITRRGLLRRVIPGSLN